MRRPQQGAGRCRGLPRARAERASFTPDVVEGFLERASFELLDRKVEEEVDAAGERHESVQKRVTLLRLAPDYRGGIRHTPVCCNRLARPDGASLAGRVV